jgi:hypothetical protein
MLTLKKINADFLLHKRINNKDKRTYLFLCTHSTERGSAHLFLNTILV